MEHDQKVWAAAAILLKRHGHEAPAVAKQWSTAFIEREDPDAAAKCLEIADAANEILSEGISRGAAREPALSEVVSLRVV
jgi:hypothetical protein